MKSLPIFTLAFIAAAVVACKTNTDNTNSSSMAQQGVTSDTNSYSIVKQGVPGMETVETRTIRATVIDIENATRKISFITPSGEKFDTVAGPEVINFSRISLGDKLLVTFTEEIVVRMAKPGEKAITKADSNIGVAAIGAKPGMLMTDTVQVVATVSAIDLKNHTATLRSSDGSTNEIKVRKDVDLSKHKIGEKVIIRKTEKFAVKIVNPN